MKKLCTVLAVLIFSVQLFAADFGLRIMPEFYIPMNETYNGFIAGKAAFDFAPVTNIRGRDSLFLSVNGGITPIAGKSLDIIPAYEAGGSLGYSLRFADRFNVTAEGYGGVWMVPGNSLPEFEESAGGPLFGGRATFNWYVLPELQLGLYGDFGVFSTNSNPLIQKVSVGLSLRYSLSNGLFSSSKVTSVEGSADQLFPVFYSHYADHPFGSYTFQNNEANDITDVVVTVFIEQFMSNPDTALSLDRVGRGESFTAPLTAFLNENILNTMGSTETVAQVKVSYKSLGKRVSHTENVILNTVSRNSMTWEDDRRAAAFVSGRDAAAYTFARRVKSIVHDSLNPNVPENIQYAAAMTSALKIYGIHYVIDPASAFTDNVGTAAVDFLQFPYQTLLYHGGDCDDLTIMNCALLEAIGIKTAFITIPGHIYMAFDAGVPVDQAAKVGNHVIYDDTVWIPLEITLPQDDFALERLTGYRQFVKYGDEAVLIPLSGAWDEYKAVCISDSDVILEYPSAEEVLNEFKKQKF